MFVYICCNNNVVYIQTDTGKIAVFPRPKLSTENPCSVSQTSPTGIKKIGAVKTALYIVL